MALHKYSIDGSSLTISDREKLIQLLDDFAYTGAIYVDIKLGLYQAFFDEADDISVIPFPSGTVLQQIHW